MAKDRNKEQEVAAGEPEKKGQGFFDKHGSQLVLAGLIIYVVLLAIGTFADIFKIQWILDWWLWRTW